MIYLREKRSGNFELSNKEEATIKFKTQKAFKEWYVKKIGYSQRIIKTTYRKSQTYFTSSIEVIGFIKKNK